MNLKIIPTKEMIEELQGRGLEVYNKDLVLIVNPRTASGKKYLKLVNHE